MPPSPPRIAAIGECMIELRHLGDDKLDLAFGGDTFNTATYIVRAGKAHALQVDYVTAVGDDPYSEAMRAFFTREGVGTALVGTIKGRLPGLYAIRTDAHGERTFYYWRREAAARDMFLGTAGEALADKLGAYDWIYLSGITLSILDETSRARLTGALVRARARGGKVVFDSNYRPRNWTSVEATRAAYLDILKRTDVALPTFSDEQAVFDDGDPLETVQRIHGYGVHEVAVKNGDAAAVASDGRMVYQIAAEPVKAVVDTTAAGDAFNGGYLAARIAGFDIERAVRAGHRLAGAVVQHRGAIIPADATPSLKSA